MGAIDTAAYGLNSIGAINIPRVAGWIAKRRENPIRIRVAGKEAISIHIRKVTRRRLPVARGEYPKVHSQAVEHWRGTRRPVDEAALLGERSEAINDCGRVVLLPIRKQGRRIVRVCLHIEAGIECPKPNRIAGSHGRRGVQVHRPLIEGSGIIYLRASLAENRRHRNKQAEAKRR